jgi:peptidase E
MERAALVIVPRILTLGGHDFTSRPPDRALGELLLRLATERAASRPRICFLPVEDGDATGQAGRFHSTFEAQPCDSREVSLPRMSRRPQELRDCLLDQDLIYISGVDLNGLLAACEAAELGSILALAWRRGIVLAGQSAGAMCWFEAGITMSAGRAEAGPGLGMIGGSLCVHYSNEPDRRDAYLRAVADGMPDGYGLDDHAGLIWEGGSAPFAVTAQRGARAYRVAAGEAGVAESPLPTRLLAAPVPSAMREDIAEFRRIRAIRRRAGWPR